jgi:anti-sigma regulatory factor (Ser/Thr protein kinase)
MDAVRFTFRFEPDFTSSEKFRKELLHALHTVQGFSCEATVTDDLCQIVSELVNNAIEHGKSSYLLGELAVGKNRVAFTLTTDGIPFDPTGVNAVMPDFDEHCDLPEGGYGLAIIRRLADEFIYTYADGKNMTTVAKRFDRQ